MTIKKNTIWYSSKERSRMEVRRMDKMSIGEYVVCEVLFEAKSNGPIGRLIKIRKDVFLRNFSLTKR